MQKNVQRVLDETANTTVTFINTFNALSIPKFKEYLQNILNLRNQYSRSNQGIKHIPIVDPYNTHPDYEIHPRQRIWFDIPIMRKPEWQNIHVLPVEYATYIQSAIDFMKENIDTDNFVGFYDFEIEKAERNLKIFLDRSTISTEEVKTNELNFVKYLDQHDFRRNTSFRNTFPELYNVYKSIGK